MNDKEPTREQVKEFWEWCGCLEIKQFPTTHPLLGGGDAVYVDAYVWKPTGQRLCHQIGACEFPPIDLNNLFKYAVPRIRGGEKGWSIGMESLIGGGWRFRLNPWAYSHIHQAIIGEDKDPALALFWAIWEVIKNG